MFTDHVTTNLNESVVAHEELFRATKGARVRCWSITIGAVAIVEIAILMRGARERRAQIALTKNR